MLDDAAPLLIKGVNINDKSLTFRQVESALLHPQFRLRGTTAHRPAFLAQGTLYKYTSDEARRLAIETLSLLRSER
jgi:hypothetical protein